MSKYEGLIVSCDPKRLKAEHQFVAAKASKLCLSYVLI